MEKIFESWAFILFFLIFILTNFALALYFKLYYLFWWLDIIHHFLGGIWLILFFNFLMKRFRITLISERQRAALFLALIGLVALIGVGWEFFEFILNRYVMSIGFLGYEDTLSDLFFDLLGGVLAFLVIL